jgi:hypothetical protein
MAKPQKAAASGGHKGLISVILIALLVLPSVLAALFGLLDTYGKLPDALGGMALISLLVVIWVAPLLGALALLLTIITLVRGAVPRKMKYWTLAWFGAGVLAAIYWAPRALPFWWR